MTNAVTVCAAGLTEQPHHRGRRQPRSADTLTGPSANGIIDGGVGYDTITAGPLRTS